MSTLPDWVRAYGPPLHACRIRTTPADFVVNELLDVDFSGDGEHDWLNIRKTGANTAWVAGRLAKFAGVSERDIGYSGLKDRHAVATQWFSVRAPGDKRMDWTALDVDGVEVRDVQRHVRKLKRGTHRGNAFRIALREVGPEFDRDSFDARIEAINQGGVPNYFGEQRFGHDGSNIGLGESVLAGRRMSRNKRSIGISALRSLQFNNELSGRVTDGTWNRVLPGDTMNLDGTNSIFVADEVTADLEQRCAALDVHPTGALPAVDPMGVKESRRPLRTRVRKLAHDIADDAVWLSFTLAKGSFATAVLREIVTY